MDAKLQEALDRCPEQGRLCLPPGEFEGPFHIRHACTIEGENTVLWAKQGPALILEARGIKLYALIVEVTRPPKTQQAAVCIEARAPDAAIDTVSVNGPVLGFPGEDGRWQIPASLQLGTFPAGQKASFLMEVETPAEASLESLVDGLQVQPQILKPGITRVKLMLDAMEADTCIFGELHLRSCFIRRIFVSGIAARGNGGYTPDRMVFAAEPLPPQPVRAQTPPAPAPQRQAQRLPVPPAAPIPVRQAPQVQQAVQPYQIPPGAHTLLRGQKLNLQEAAQGPLAVRLEFQGEGIEIDPYAFLLDESGAVKEKGNFVYFKNWQSPNRSVRYVEKAGQKLLRIRPEELPETVARVVVAYAIYGGEGALPFSAVKRPVLVVEAQEGAPLCFPLEGLSEERTVVAVELYRYKGIWKLSAVGAGYRDGLKRLCGSFRLEVE